MKITIYGSGAAGSVFGAYLRIGGAEVTLIDRYEAHMKKVREDGLKFNIHQLTDGEYHDTSMVLDGFHTFTDAASAADVMGPADAILYMTKATQLRTAVQDSMPLVNENTVAITLINGLGNDDVLFETFPKNHCVVGSGVLGTLLNAPGECTVTPIGAVHMNFGAAERSELADQVCREMAAAFNRGGCHAFWRADDIYHYIWKKAIMNASSNVISAVTRLKVGYFETDPWGHQVDEDIMREACAVANAKGVVIDADQMVNVDYPAAVRCIYDYYPSMAQDALIHQRETEIDNLTGKIADYGEQLGVPTPVCRTMANLMHVIQNNYAHQYPAEK